MESNLLKTRRQKDNGTERWTCCREVKKAGKEERKEKAPAVITKKGNKSDGAGNSSRLEHDETVK